MDARLKAAETILERGVRFRLPAPFWKRLLKKDWITIRHLKAGTILEIARVVLGAKLENAIALGDYEFLAKAVEPCTRCIAIAVLNDKKQIDRDTDKLTERLLWQVSAESLIDIFLKIAVMNRVSDFTIITRFLLNQTTMMTERKNLGQTENGS